MLAFICIVYSVESNIFQLAGKPALQEAGGIEIYVFQFTANEITIDKPGGIKMQACEVTFFKPAITITTLIVAERRVFQLYAFKNTAVKITIIKKPGVVHICSLKQAQLKSDSFKNGAVHIGVSEIEITQHLVGKFCF